MRVKRAHESQSQQRHASPWPSHHEATWQLQGDPIKVSSGRFDMTRGVEGAMVEDCQGSGHGINGRVRGVEQGLRDGKRAACARRIRERTTWTSSNRGSEGSQGGTSPVLKGGHVRQMIP